MLDKSTNNQSNHFYSDQSPEKSATNNALLNKMQPYDSFYKFYKVQSTPSFNLQFLPRSITSSSIQQLNPVTPGLHFISRPSDSHA